MNTTTAQETKATRNQANTTLAADQAEVQKRPTRGRPVSDKQDRPERPARINAQLRNIQRNMPYNTGKAIELLVTAGGDKAALREAIRLIQDEQRRKVS